MIRRLDRYILGTFLGPLVLSIVFSIGMFIVIETAEKLDNFVERPGGEHVAILLVKYYLYRLPILLPKVTMVMTLMAAAIAVIRLSKSNELMVMKALGQDLRRVMAPLLVAAFLVALAAAALQEAALPLLSGRIQRTTDQLFGSGKNFSNIYENVAVSDDEGNLLLAGKYDSDRRRFEGADLFEAKPDERYHSQPKFDWGEYDTEAGIWRVKGARDKLSDDGRRKIRVEITTWKTGLTPEDFIERRFQIELRGIGELLRRARIIRRYMRYIASDGTEPIGVMQRKLRTHMHNRLALPFANVALLLVGLPFVVRDKDHSSVTGILLAVLICVAFYATNLMLLDLGSNEDFFVTIMPWMAGWGSTIIFWIVGLYHFRRTSS